MTTREIDERIAAALERVANGRGADLRLQLHAVAAELRAAEPAIVWECPSCDFACAGKIGIFGGHTDCHGKKDHARVGCVIVPKPAPPPSLVERLRREINIGTAGILEPMLLEVVAALEAAQAVNMAAFKVVAAWRCGRFDDLNAAIQALAATMERKP